MNECVEHLDSLPGYQQDSGPNIRYQFVVKPGTMGLMSAGRVRLKGPTKKAKDVHTGWDQIYLVLRGAGQVVVGDKTFRVASNHVVRIPRNTLHGVILSEGEELEYVYVNAFQNEAALNELLRTLP
jgi:mannose-6-phosphate isomerase-like protein (cupin superfamily)